MKEASRQTARTRTQKPKGDGRRRPDHQACDANSNLESSKPKCRRRFFGLNLQ